MESTSRSRSGAPSPQPTTTNKVSYKESISSNNMEQGASEEDTAIEVVDNSEKCLTPRASIAEGVMPKDTHRVASEDLIDETAAAGKSANTASINTADRANTKLTSLASNNAIEAIDAASKDETNPRAGKVESLTPTSSSKRSVLRRASFSGSPSAGRSVGSPSLGFGAGLRNVPAPIDTQARSMPDGPIQAPAVLEPLPASTLPGIDLKLAQLATAQLNQTLDQNSQPIPPMATNAKVNRRTTIPKVSTKALQPNRPTGQQKPTQPSQQPNSYIVNPYIYRADVIGPGHHIPSVGHLGDLLTPPDWVPGNDPITIVEATKLFQQARTRATALLNLAAKKIGVLNTKEQGQQDIEGQKKWEIQLKLDQILYAERKHVYETWQAGKAKAMQEQQTSLQRQHQPGIPPPSTLPQPHDPPTGASAQAYTQYQQSQLRRSPNLYTTGPSLSAGVASTHSRLQELQRGLHYPMRSPMSPGTLDPSLIPETLQSVYSYYYNNRSMILEMQGENEAFLAIWCAKFRAPMPHSPRGFPQTNDDQHGHTFVTAQHGYMPHHQNGDDLMQAKFQGGRIGSYQVHAPGQPKTQPNQRILGMSQGNPRHEYPRASSGPLDRLSPQPQGDRRKILQVNAPPSARLYTHQPNIREAPPVSNGSVATKIGKYWSPERRDSGADIPRPSKEAGAQYPGIVDTKPVSWYHNAMSEAELPSSVISQAALQAGLNFGSAGKKNKDSSKPRSRNSRKPTTNQQRGFLVSLDAAEAFKKMGVVDATGPAPVLTPVNNTPPGLTHVAAPQNESSASDVSQPTHGATRQSAIDPNRAPYYFASRPSSLTALQNSSLPSYVSQYQPTGVGQLQCSVPSNDGTISAPISAALSLPSTQSSSDAPDDPKDLTFGARVRPRKTPTARATPAARKPSEGTKRRNSKSSEAATETAKKRARQGIDGAANQDVPV